MDELYLYDVESPRALLEEACAKADFVFNLAGVNRPKNTDEFMEGNYGFASELLNGLKAHGNTCCDAGSFHPSDPHRPLR